MTSNALEGLKIADFTWAAVGPITTKFLADFGATVVKIETSKRLDVMRMVPPFMEKKPGINRSAYFAFFNANKYSLALDLGKPGGIDVAKSLVSWADVVVENFTPGIMEKWGLGYDELRKIKPDIIMLRNSNQGQTGPSARHPGTGLQLVGLSGFTNLTGWPDRDPVQPWGGYTDLTAVRLGVLSLVGALFHRKRTGKGQCIDMSQLETGVHFLTPALLDYNVNQKINKRAGNSNPDAAPHNVYRCKGDDRWCVITILSDQEWESFGRVFPELEWTKESRFESFEGRKRYEQELDKLIEAWTIKQTPKEVMNLLQGAGIRAGMVQDAKDLYLDPQLKQDNIFWPIKHKEMGMVSHLGQPIHLSKCNVKARLPAPCLGEHTEMVCKEILGMPDEEFEDLSKMGIFS